MKLFSLLLVSILFLSAGLSHADTTRGGVTGGIAYDLPGWFKNSFLDFSEDVQEARAQGKHVLVFFHLEACPYCARMLEENFVTGDSKNFIQKNFDVIAVDIRGNRELTWVDRATYTEKAVSKKLGVYATPALVFLDGDGRKVLQLNGYREPHAFRLALQYVHEKKYREQSLADYLAGQKQASVYTLRAHPAFVGATDFKNYRKPLALLFENKSCHDCAAFHDKTLNHPEVLSELSKFLLVRLDTDSTAALRDLEGKPTDAGAWAKKLGMSYRPGVVLFNEGKEVARMDTRFYHYHFRELLRYVSGKHYRRFGSFSAYSAHRREELSKQDATIDYSE